MFTIGATVEPAATGILSTSASATLPSELNEVESSDNSSTESDDVLSSQVFADGLKSCSWSA